MISLPKTGIRILSRSIHMRTRGIPDRKIQPSPSRRTATTTRYQRLVRKPLTAMTPLVMGGTSAPSNIVKKLGSTKTNRPITTPSVTQTSSTG